MKKERWSVLTGQLKIFCVIRRTMTCWKVRIEGQIEGNLEGKLEIAANMLQKERYAFEDIAEATGSREEQVWELERQKEHDNPTS